MSKVQVLPAPGVLDIAAYKAGAAGQLVRNPVRLASNEAALGASPNAIRAATEANGQVDRYPDPTCGRLRASLSQKYAIPADNILCGAGSETLIHVAMRTFVSVGDEVIVPTQAFVVGRIAALSCGAQVVSIPAAGKYGVDLDGIIAAVTDRTKVVYLPNPNNPTGTMLTSAQVRSLRQSLPDRVLLMLDAAYRDYLDRPDYSSGDELVESEDGNVMVFGTFSKSYALAGLRIGWCHAPARLVELMNRVRCTFNVNGPGLAAAVAAIEDTEHLGRELALVREQRLRFEVTLAELSIAAAPSDANFVMIEFQPDQGTGATATAFLAERGVFVRPTANYGLDQCLRITIGTAQQMQQVADGLAAYLARRRGLSSGE